MTRLTKLQLQLYQKTVDTLQAKDIANIGEASLWRLVDENLQSLQVLLPKGQKQHIIESTVFAILGLGPLEFLLKDETITEIMVNGTDKIFVEKMGKLTLTELKFASEEQLLNVILKIVGKIGRRIDEKVPMVDARLEDGSRVNAIIAPLSRIGPVLTIRKFPTKTFGISDIIAHNSATEEMIEYLRTAVEGKKNMLVSGGTGAGKTSTLNALASLIAPDERVITIEDIAEIRIDHPHLISLESRPPNIEGNGEIPIRTLLKNSLRMRPDRIVVGEIRGAEALDMLQAMNTGHQGSLTTVHANTPLEALYRVETMVLMSEADMPIQAIRPQVSQALDIVIQQSRLSDGSRKIIDISEVVKKNDKYEVKQIFKFDKLQETFVNLTKTQN